MKVGERKAGSGLQNNSQDYVLSQGGYFEREAFQRCLNPRSTETMEGIT